MNEIWKDIEGFEGKYQVSNLGNVKSLNYNNTKKEGLLKPTQISKKKKYLTVTLSKNQQKKNYYVHILVAKAFIPNLEKLPEVNHKDENPQNNAVSNLEWCDRLYNINYGTGIERSAAKRRKAVRCIENDKVYPSISAAAWDLGISIAGVSYVCCGKRKTCAGYHFEYVSES